MNALLAGFTHSSGTARESGKPFDIKSLILLNPASNVAKTNYNKQAVGYEPVEIPVAESAKPQFMALTYPCRATLVISHELFAGKLQAVASGVQHVIQLTEQTAKTAA